MAIQSAEEHIAELLTDSPADRLQRQTARDAAIRAEERDWRVDSTQAANLILSYLGIASGPSLEPGLDRRRDQVAYIIDRAIRARPRAQPVLAPEHGDLSSRSGAKAEGGAERAKETGDE